MANSKQARLVATIRRFAPQVNRVADSTRANVITVDAADVKRADVADPSNCALACSFKRAGYDAAIIHPTVAYLIKGDLAVRYRVPESVTREIVSFDRAKDFRTGDYQLSAIEPCRRLGAARVRKARVGGVRKVAYKKPIRHFTEGIR